MIPWKFEQLEENVILVQKPLGISSTSITDFYKITHKLKVGHGGTLDPLATGAMVVLCNSATKKATEFLAKQKTYRFTMVLGATTETLDLEKPLVIDENFENHFSHDELKAKISEFIGIQEHQIPTYSAARVNGKYSYELARKGIATDAIPTRQVEIINLEINGIIDIQTPDFMDIITKKQQDINENYKILEDAWKSYEMHLPGKSRYMNSFLVDALEEQKQHIKDISRTWTLIDITATVSKGTYIRSLAQDLANLFKTTGMVVNLDRISI